MFGDFELEPYPSGLLFPPADEEAWRAFQAALARLRRPESPRLSLRKPAASAPLPAEPLFFSSGLGGIVAPASPQ